MTRLHDVPSPWAARSRRITTRAKIEEASDRTFRTVSARTPSCFPFDHEDPSRESCCLTASSSPCRHGRAGSEEPQEPRDPEEPPSTIVPIKIHGNRRNHRSAAPVGTPRRRHALQVHAATVPRQKELPLFSTSNAGERLGSPTGAMVSHSGPFA